ncbi:MAG: flagellin [bacterium]
MAIVNTNFNSLTALRYIRLVERQIGYSINRLSTGRNLTFDDPSGFALSSRLNAQTGGVQTAIQNAEDALSLTQVAYSVLDSTMEMLLRMRDLSVRAANDATLSSADYTDLNDEFADLRNTIDTMAKGATFNDRELFTGSYAAGRAAQVGPDNNANQRYSIVIATATVSAIAGGTNDLWSVTLLSAGAAASAQSVVDRSIDYTSNIQASLGVQQRSLNAMIDALSSAETNLSAASSRITDADMASEISRFSKLQIVSEAGVAALAHSNDLDSRVVSLMDEMTG